jgi:type I restriction enzyme S subunit
MSRNWRRVLLGEVCEIQQGNNLAISKLTGGEFPVYGANGVVGYFDDWNFDREVVALGCRGSCGTLHSVRQKAWLANNVMAIWPKKDAQADLGFIQLSLEVADLKSAGVISGQVQPQITRRSLSPLQIALPHLAEQRRIVDLVSSVDSYIAALQQQADAAHVARSAVLSELLSAGGDDWTETTIGAISDFISLRVTPAKLDALTPYVGLEHLVPKSAEISDWDTVRNISSSVTPFEPGDTLFGRLRPYLHKVAFADFSGTCSPELLVLRSNANCDAGFLYLLCALDSTIGNCVAMSAGTRMPRTSTSDLASIEVQLPPLVEQQHIVSVISSLDEVIRSTEQATAAAKNLRSGLLSDLLSGNHEIPESYDRLLGAA